MEVGTAYNITGNAGMFLAFHTSSFAVLTNFPRSKDGSIRAFVALAFLTLKKSFISISALCFIFISIFILLLYMHILIIGYSGAGCHTFCLKIFVFFAFDF